MRPLSCLWIGLLIGTLLLGLGQKAFAQDAEADQAKALLDQGIKLHKDMDFQKAQETLLKVQKDKLTDAQKKDLATHLQLVADGVKAQKAARDAYEQGVTALEANELDKAAKLFEQAAASEYLPAPERQAARAQVALVAKKKEAAGVAKAADNGAAPAAAPAVEAPAAPATAPTTAPVAAPGAGAEEAAKMAALQQRIVEAKALIAEGNKALDADQVDRAVALFQKAVEAAPEYPPAHQDLERARSLQGEVTGGLSAITQTDRLRRIRKQQNDVLFAQAMQRAREAVQSSKSKEDFMRAAQEVNYSQTLLATHRSLYTDTEYNEKKIETEKLAEFIAVRESEWQKRLVAGQVNEIERSRIQREQEQTRQKLEKITTLKRRVRALREEQRFTEAVEVLDRIIQLDPTDSWAQEWQSQLSRFVRLLEDKEAHHTGLVEEQKQLVEIRRAQIPWYDLLRYPRDWREITQKRKQFVAGDVGESEADRQVRKALSAILPRLEFSAIPLSDVIQFLRDVSNVNIHVKWEALRAATIDQRTPVNVKLTQVTVEKALRTVLEDVGGVNPLSFVLDQGVITISTKDDLSRQTVTKVYDIRDLIVRVPNFQGPRIDLTAALGNNTGGNNGTGGGAGGGLFGAGAGAGGAGAGTTTEEEETMTRAELVKNILDLIQGAIAPDTWRGGQAAGTIGSIRELNGQIIVTQTSENQRALVDLLAGLREARALQINVEARFVSVSTGYLNHIGVNLDFYFNLGSRLGGGAPGAGGVIFDNAPGGAGTKAVVIPTKGDSDWTTAMGRRPPGWNYMTPMGLVQNQTGLNFARPQDTGITGSIGSAVTGSALSMGGTFLDDVQVDFLLAATQAHQSTRTLTAPRITIFNGQRAYVAIQDQQAYVAELEPIVGDNVVAFRPVVSTVSTGSVLDVEGTVSADRRYVTLTVRPQVTRILGFTEYQQTIDTTDPDNPVPTESTGLISLPNISNQQLECTVSVPDGGTLLLGGQRLAGEIEREIGVPILSKIPILNRAFTNRSITRDEQTLLILVKPKIIIQTEIENDTFPP